MEAWQYRVQRISVTVMGVLLLLGAAGGPAQPAHARPAGAYITVDTNNDSDARDNELSLREALELASGALTFCLTDHERNQISGGNWYQQPPTPSCAYDPLNEKRWSVDPNNVSPGIGHNYADHIVFASGVTTIQPTSPLPQLWYNDNIDGGGGGYSGKVRILGTSAGSGHGIELNDSGPDNNTTSSEILNLVIQGFPNDGIHVGDYFVHGYTVTSLVLQGLEIYNNGGRGIYVATAGFKNPRNMQIGGGSASQRNVISCNGGNGVELLGTNAADFGSDFGNTIQNNYVGVKSDGVTTCANGGNGIRVLHMRGTTIVGNILSGNNQDGLKLEGQGSINNQILSNSIGVDASRTKRLGNALGGITLASAANNNQIGSLGNTNFIGGNGVVGIGLYDSGTTGNVIAHNEIGDPISNTIGVRIVAGASLNTLDQNTISGNATFGVLIDGSGTQTNTLTANRIGTTFNGSSALPNGSNGVQIRNGANANVIGLAGQGNLISGNGNDGVNIMDSGTNRNMLYGNIIGLNAAGTAKLGNAQSGVDVANGPSGTIIGGENADDRNVISGNSQFGVSIGGGSTTATTVAGNYIGLNAAGAGVLPNQLGGVQVSDASGTMIGGGPAQFISGNLGPGIKLLYAAGTAIDVSNSIGTAADNMTPAGNGSHGILVNGAISSTISALIIANNGGAGIAVTGNGAVGNRLTPFTVKSNGGLAIDLGNDGFTPNGLHTPPGPDNWLPYPVITSASGTTITGTACFDCYVLVYRAWGNPAGPGGGASAPLATTADSAGNWSINLCCGLTPGAVTLQAWQGALADGSNNASELSPRYLPDKLYLPLIRR